MTLLLTTAFLALSALAIPTNPPVHPRQLPALGIESSQLFDQLTFNTYANAHCTVGDGTTWNGYGLYAIAQMQSYKLSRALHDNEVLEFFTSLGAGAPSRYSVDYGLNDEGEAACVLYDSTAGLNATDGDDNNGDGRGKGCHTLKHNEACANLFQT